MDFEAVLVLSHNLLDNSHVFQYFLMQIHSNINSGNDMDSDIMTIKEVSSYLKLKEKTTYRLTLEGKLPAFKVGASWRFRKADIDSWIKQQTEGKTEETGEE
jgi:excisionase family DNA binding protein